jgi:large subunit ribosomal protein L25
LGKLLKEYILRRVLMTSSLNANIRNHVSKGDNHRLRNQGRIPGVIYGLNAQNFNVEFAEEEVFDIMNKSGEHAVLNVNVNGKQEKAMIKEVQRDPLTRRVLHLDVQRVDDEHKITAKVPVRIVGEDQVRRNKGMSQVQLDQIEVFCTADKLPRFITADVSRVPIGGKITLGDIEVAEEISIVGDPATIIVSVSHMKDMQIEQESPSEAMAIHEEQAK